MTFNESSVAFTHGATDCEIRTVRGPFDRSMNINRAKQCTQLVCIKAQPRDKSDPNEGWTNARAIKSCRVAKTPSEFYLSFQPSFHLTAIGRESPTTFVGFPSPSASSGDQTLIGLDSGSLPPFPAFLSCEILVSLFGNLSLPLSFLLLSLSPLSLAQCSKGTLFLPLERTSAGHVSNRLPR